MYMYKLKENIHQKRTYIKRSPTPCKIYSRRNCSKKHGLPAVSCKKIERHFNGNAIAVAFYDLRIYECQEGSMKLIGLQSQPLLCQRRQAIHNAMQHPHHKPTSARFLRHVNELFELIPSEHRKTNALESRRFLSIIVTRIAPYAPFSLD